MRIQPTIGSCLAFHAGPAPTHDIDGFGGLTYLHSGELVTIGDVGPESEVISVSTVCDGVVNKALGARNYGQQSNILVFKSDNGAQEVVEDASEDGSIVAVKETLSSGDVIYYHALVSSFKIQSGGTSDYLRAAVNFEIDGKLVKSY